MRIPIASFLATPNGREGCCTSPRAETAFLKLRIKLKCPDVRMSGCPDVRMSGCPDVRMSGCPDVRMSGCPGVRVSGCPLSRGVGPAPGVVGGRNPIASFLATPNGREGVLYLPPSGACVSGALHKTPRGSRDPASGVTKKMRSGLRPPTTPSASPPTRASRGVLGCPRGRPGIRRRVSPKRCDRGYALPPPPSAGPPRSLPGGLRVVRRVATASPSQPCMRAHD